MEEIKYEESSYHPLRTCPLDEPTDKQNHTKKDATVGGVKLSVICFDVQIQRSFDKCDAGSGDFCEWSGPRGTPAICHHPTTLRQGRRSSVNHFAQHQHHRCLGIHQYAAQGSVCIKHPINLQTQNESLPIHPLSNFRFLFAESPPFILPRNEQLKYTLSSNYYFFSRCVYKLV
jgi:hypothetical protein